MLSLDVRSHVTVTSNAFCLQDAEQIGVPAFVARQQELNQGTPKSVPAVGHTLLGFLVWLVAAVKYFDLRQNRNSDYRFSFDSVLDPKGNTAVCMGCACCWGHDTLLVAWM
eukprot:1839282-Amphidinium_carterae.1